MASAESQKPTCPVCNQADQVKTSQAAYDAGVTRCAPPDMPTKQVSMMSYIVFGILIVGICVLLIFILIGGMGSHMDVTFATALVAITLICIVTALVVSYIAFQRVVRGDAETTVRLPAWDRAMEKWRKLYYCSRDDVVFDAQTKQALSDDQLAALRKIGGQEAEEQSAMLARH